VFLTSALDGSSVVSARLHRFAFSETAVGRLVVSAAALDVAKTTQFCATLLGLPAYSLVIELNELRHKMSFIQNAENRVYSYIIET
jgi:hypothetical protein